MKGLHVKFNISKILKHLGENMGKYFHQLSAKKNSLSRTKAKICIITVITRNIFKLKLYPLKFTTKRDNISLKYVTRIHRQEYVSSLFIVTTI